MAKAPRSRLRAPNKRREAGAILVETSIVAMVLLVITSGILEYSGVFGFTIDSSYAVRNAARVGAITTATGPNDDSKIISALVQKAGAKRTTIQEVVVYEADDAGAAPPPQCMAGVTSAANKCNVYTAAEITNPSSLATKSGWPVASRDPGVNFIGVYAKSNRKPLLGLVPSPSNLEDSFTLQLAPFPLGSDALGWHPTIPGGPQLEGNNWDCWDTRGCSSIGSGSGGFGNAGGGGSSG